MVRRTFLWFFLHGGTVNMKDWLLIDASILIINSYYWMCLFWQTYVDLTHLSWNAITITYSSSTSIKFLCTWRNKQIVSSAVAIDFPFNFIAVPCWEGCRETLVWKEQTYIPSFEMGGKLIFFEYPLPSCSYLAQTYMSSKLTDYTCHEVKYDSSF